ncbi:SDR family oxidoreductase [Methylotenera mobilis]|uniref:NAD-dependent epimerase/dehydratase n=1 Tax=Methylotenera mobilis (strain JLW8 / ATCC BAA-1282 / DSM 17540) TaxID=583345 RepID=C6WX45_METML|nr:SDR family oxidoreductase [Methylotenera mobilis]ACT48494.1 NAD-dependent epimerase/dehydratase [Methylotenera mobilis JLW8]
MHNTPRTKVLIIGYGDLGSAIATRLTGLNAEVYAVARSPKAAPQVHMLQADVTVYSSLDVLRTIQPDIIVYCVAATGQTDAQYQQAYVDGLRNVLLTQQVNSQLKHVFFVSSTRVYGQVTDELLDELTAAAPVDFGGERLLEAESLLNSMTCGNTVLRLSGIYGPGRLRMINLAKAPERWPIDNSWTNRIQRDDAANFIVHLIQQVIAGRQIRPCYIVTDCKPVSQYEVLNWIAVQLGLKPAAPPAVSGGKRLSNQAMLATGFVLQYPDYQAGYQALLAELVNE